MNDKEFLFKQFQRRNIPQGTKDYKDFENCKRLIQMQSKLSPQIYDEMLKIAIEYTEV